MNNDIEAGRYYGIPPCFTGLRQKYPSDTKEYFTKLKTAFQSISYDAVIKFYIQAFKVKYV